LFLQYEEHSLTSKKLARPSYWSELLRISNHTKYGPKPPKAVKGKEISWRYTKYISSNLGGISTCSLAANEYPKFRLGETLCVVVSRTKSYSQSLKSLRDLCDFKPPMGFSSFRGSLSSTVISLLSRKWESLLRSITFSKKKLLKKLRLARLARRLLTEGRLFDCYNLLKSFRTPLRVVPKKIKKSPPQPKVEEVIPEIIPPKEEVVPGDQQSNELDSYEPDSYISDGGAGDSSEEAYVRKTYPHLVGTGLLPEGDFWDEFREEGMRPEDAYSIIYSLRPSDYSGFNQDSSEELDI
jgi:hypothetical protein